MNESEYTGGFYFVRYSYDSLLYVLFNNKYLVICTHVDVIFFFPTVEIIMLYNNFGITYSMCMHALIPWINNERI